MMSPRARNLTQALLALLGGVVVFAVFAAA